ncbi:MAG: hypothetical protein NTX87_16685 [Planctomycetota bacterium]|nr:hypothetical protein [Planctomycetota bacterium]
MYYLRILISVAIAGPAVNACAGDAPARPTEASPLPGTARLAERGFITFAPQNLYLFGDRFRTLQRKANPIPGSRGSRSSSPSTSRSRTG